MNFLQSILENSSVPVITAFILGLLTAVSPCPLATNITAIGFIGKDIENRHRIFINGLLYTLGRILTYTVLGFILIPILREGASMFSVQKAVSQYGEILIAPLLIVIGIYMLDLIKLNIPKISINGEYVKKRTKGSWGALFLGILFSLAFCPSSGIFFFGMLIPLSAAEAGGYLLPVVYAIATGLPVILVAWVLAYSVAGLGKFYNRIKAFEKWFRKIVAILFIAVGIYYAVMFYL
ncbi:MAG: aromatic aminobenezylarsenical efflux permease ArsG family transporter [Parabacteroides sp.]|nr:aromatic aminobenezylarsenical efflux permease ArsG family transporter [Parabacteroides sp.]